MLPQRKDTSCFFSPLQRVCCSRRTTDRLIAHLIIYSQTAVISVYVWRWAEQEENKVICFLFFKAAVCLLLIGVFARASASFLHMCVSCVRDMHASEEMEAERKAAAAAAAVASKTIIHCWECYNLDYISCSLKVYFPINSNPQLIKINSASA